MLNQLRCAGFLTVFVLFALTTCWPNTADAASVQTCHMQKTGKRTVAPDVRVHAPKTRDPLKVGKAVRLSWKVKTRLDPACRTPLYLMFSTSGRVRFEGGGFIALAPGAKGPFGLTRKLRRTRVFVPLHIGRLARTGRLDIKVFDTGEFKVHWELVEVPALVQNPRSISDYMGSKPTVARFQKNTATFQVGPGAPFIVVQDRYTTETPIKTIYATNETYELRVFESFYRVFDLKTGELVIERDGVSPNFSPTARFVHALLENTTGAEIVDLYSGTTIYRFDSRLAMSPCGTPDSQSASAGVNIIAWGTSDSFMLLSPNHSDAHFANSLIDRPPTPIAPYGTYKQSVSDTADLHVDLEALAVALKPVPEIGTFDPVWYSLLDFQEEEYACANSEEKSKERRYKEKYNLFPSVWPEHSSRNMRWLLGSDTRIGYAGFCHICGLERVVTRVADAREILERKIPEYLTKQTERRDWLARQARNEISVNALLVRHPATRPVSAEATRASARNRDLRMRSARRGLTWVEYRAGRVLDRFTDVVRIKLKDNAPSTFLEGEILVWSPDKRAYHQNPETWNKRFARVLQRHIHSPAYKRALDVFTPEKTDYGLADISTAFACEAGFPHIGEFVVPARVIARTAWQDGDTRLWLVQQQCVGGGGLGFSNGQLGLLVKRRVGLPQFTPFTEELGLDSGKAVKAWLSRDGLLMVAAPNGTLLVYDTKTGRRVAYIKNASDADIASGLHVTQDRKLLIQINQNGSVTVYRLKAGKPILSGYYLDEEFVLYRDDGVYAATHEGAQFIFFKFPGMAGYHSFQQFSRTLNRPDVINAVLTDKKVPPPVQLTAPPALKVDVDVIRHSGTRTASLRYRAGSPLGLDTLAIYVDGRPVLQRDLSGRTASGEIVVPLEPEARWISAVAADASGYESVAQVEALEGAAKATASKLFVIAVGTNQYDNLPDGARLVGAVPDAEGFVTQMKALAGGAYATVEHVSFIDARGLKDALPRAIREVSARAGPRDTIMLFAAGHGFRDYETGKFFLFARDSRDDRLADTALDWVTIASAFEGVKARVFAFIDACHAGAFGAQGTNDEAVAALLAKTSAITVIAAAKGRQESGDDRRLKAGVFTAALLTAIGSDRAATDINKNGALELSEVYARVKRAVVKRSRGNQTPWIARNQMVGEVPVF